MNEKDHDDPVAHLTRSVAEGRQNWYLCLLEAIALWTVSEETCYGRHFKYLISGQAFDWWLLAERLCMEIEGLIPEDERINLIFGHPPIEVPQEQFKSIIGSEKYQAHLNYFYGVLVEQVLHVVAELEIDKEKGNDSRKKCSADEVYNRIYGLPEAEMLQRFRQEKDAPQGEAFTVTQFKEFIYWLFKFRVANSDSSRLASDTKKALKYLEKMRADLKYSFPPIY